MPLKNSKFSLIKTTIITVFWLTIVIIVLSMYGLIFFPNFRTMLIYQLAKPKVLKLESDVPISFGGFPDQSWQSTLSIDSCKIEVIPHHLRLFESQSLVRFILKGSLTYIHSDWQPYIQEINISERLVRNDGYELVGDILITPIVGQKYIKKNNSLAKNIDINSNKSNKAFNIKVEKIVNTFNDGYNRYIVHIGNKNYKFEIFLDNTNPL